MIFSLLFAHPLSLLSEGSLFVNNSLLVLTHHIIKRYSRGREKGRCDSPLSLPRNGLLNKSHEKVKIKCFILCSEVLIKNVAPSPEKYGVRRKNYFIKNILLYIIPLTNSSSNRILYRLPQEENRTYTSPSSSTISVMVTQW